MIKNQKTSYYCKNNRTFFFVFLYLYFMKHKKSYYENYESKRNQNMKYNFIFGLILFGGIALVKYIYEIVIKLW